MFLAIHWSADLFGETVIEAVSKEQAAEKFRKLAAEAAFLTDMPDTLFHTSEAEIDDEEDD